MVGNADDARAALEGKGILRNLHPDGMAGYRRVHLINGVIYKIDNSRYGCQANDEEMRNYIRLTEHVILPPHLRVPKMAEYEIDGHLVVAAEYIDGPHMATEDFDRVWDEWAGLTGLIDLHPENIKVRDGIYYLIDVDK